MRRSKPGRLGNRTYQMAERTAQLETAPTKPENVRGGWKPHLPAPINRDRNRGAKVYLFLESTTVCGFESQSDRSWYKML